MKNIVLMIACFFTFSGVVNAQAETSVSPNGFADVNEAAEMATQIVKAAGMKPNFRIAEAKVPNAVAVMHQGQRFIFYNPDFIERLTRLTGTKWAAISVLAHEIGHHLYRKGGNPAMENKLSSELEADEFSGYVLEKMGATLEEAQAAMKMLATEYATSTHPARSDRISSIQNGWVNAGGDIASVKTSTLDQPSTITYTGAVAATIRFDASPDASYIVTKKMNVIRVRDDQAAMIGKIARSDNERFPYVIYDDTGYTLFVNNFRNIITKEGKKVGSLKAVSDNGETANSY